MDTHKSIIRRNLREVLREINSNNAPYVFEKYVDQIAYDLEQRSNEPQGDQPRNSASFLRLIQGILAAVRAGESRSSFLARVMRDINDVPASYRKNRCIVLLSAYADEQQRVKALTAPHIAGGMAGRHGEFERHLPDYEASGFYRDLILHRRRYNFDPSPVLTEYGEPKDCRYDDEFARLIDGDLWICALPLAASERGEPERCLLGLYKMEDEYATPQGARQEWDILRLVPMIFNLLQERVRTLQEQVDEEQQRIVTELGSSAISHELGTGLGLLGMSLQRTPDFLRGLAEKVGTDDPNLLGIAQELADIAGFTRRASKTTEAFTNLERRSPGSIGSNVKLSKIVEDLLIVLQRQLNLVRISVKQDIPTDLDVVTDVRFVEHILMNVIINAIEAIELAVEKMSETEQETVRHEIAIYACERGNDVEITVANNGPPIPVEISQRVFERGVTSKPFGVGHGQGMYLSRQIAQHLNGRLKFGTPPPNMPDANVTFLLTIPKIAKFESDT